MLPLTPTGGLEPPRLGSAGGKRSDWFALGVTESSSEFSIGIANALPDRRGKHVKKNIFGFWKKAMWCGRLNLDGKNVKAEFVAFVI